MMKHLYLCVGLIALILTPALLRAQDLFTALGGVRAPNVRVTMAYGTVDMEATHQGFIRRAVSNSAYEFDHSGGYGYGYGYESIHFTFASFKRMDLLREKRRVAVFLDFYGLDDVWLYRKRIEREMIQSYCPQPVKDAPCSYEIDLKGVILAMIDNVRRVDVVVME